MDIRTHQQISHALCGTPRQVGHDGTSCVDLLTDDRMTVDDQRLVHGGFIFGLADHAAMIAVNHPHVVLGAADVRFTKPVKSGQTVTAEARVTQVAGKKHTVEVSVTCEAQTVFSGVFTCFVLEKHVLAP